ncbi:beta-lactamase family protein [Paenibacillus mesophilus]|uniref:serine hydrolase domain-containing protein n=1 Tax=Paenibacillus mesophilus TaxID=2582849 RepID=UPI00110E82B1|nr:serine hydrolase domain-containing protein [Paenibacillus mesophilus]TMV50094.1 beta-lactamase family protein [Paenibacillus mesophilus]
MLSSTSLHAHAFTELNEHVFRTKRLVSASAASILVILNGRIVNESYCGYHDHPEDSRPIDAESRFNVASIRKTYLGLAVSLALYEGKIKSINDYIVEYLDGLDPAVFGSTTIRHLLTHTHGLQGSHQRIFAPGTNWKYNNAGVNLLIKLIHNVFGQPLSHVLEDQVLNPYGFKETGWEKQKTEKLVWLNESYPGDQGGEANLFVSTRELAYWGYLHMKKGRIRERQALPASIFEQAVSIATPAGLDDSLPRNGFFWWVQDRPRPASEMGSRLPVGSFQSLGLYGNAVVVIPEYDAVAVRMLNQTGPNPPGFDYLQDIQSFGNAVCSAIIKYRSMELGT